MTTEKLILEFDAKATKLISELDKVNSNLDKNQKKTKDSEEQNRKWEISAKDMGAAALKIAAGVGAASVALGVYATAQGRAIRETEVMANIAGLSVDEFRRMSFVMGTVGLSAEQFGGIMKDTQERIGDFLASGGGAFQDFADVMGYTKQQTINLATEFEKMSGQEVLQAMVNRMEEANKSTRKISFALEGMASESTRLIPILTANGKAAKELGDAFDDIDMPLTDEERKQFKELADNVDLASGAFINMLNKAIAPLIPIVSDLAKELAGVFADIQLGDEVDAIFNEPALIKNIKDIEKIDQLLKAVELKRSATVKTQDLYSPKYVANALYNSEQITLALKAARHEAETFSALDAIDVKVSTTTETNSTGNAKTGVDTIELKEKLDKELKERIEAQKSTLKLLEEEREERLKIIGAFDKQESELTKEQLSKKKQIEDSFTEQVRESVQTDDSKKVEEAKTEIASLQELRNAGLVNEEEYQAKLIEIKSEFATDADLLREKLAEELEARQDAKKSVLKLLEEERDERLELIGAYGQRENELTSEQLEQKKQIEDSYKEQADEAAKSDLEKKIEEGVAELNALTELRNAGFDVEQAYQERLLQMKMEIAPETVDPEIMEEQNQAALEALDAMLEEDLSKQTEYFEALNKLGKKDGKDKEKRKETENFWSDSSTKKQLDDGMDLLSALGNNSKTAHKIKQGLAVANAGMNTAEGITKALAEQNYVGAALTAATGVTQIAAILASTPNGGGGSVSAPSSSKPEPQALIEPDTNQQSTTVTDISGGEQSTQRFAFEFSDAIIDVIAKKVKESKSEGRI
jgi:hypothetical protein